MMEQTVVTIKFDFLGDKAEAINKSLRLIHREMDRGSIIGGTISEVGNTYDIKNVSTPAATDVETKDGN
ncbi:hypothetical protein ACTNEN_09735 [Oribacterium sp. HCP28S3_H8]|uniref:hypothetical protein n=1 Tax=Oribacterium sp. HCP28S3_H8 TaxID=3438945 RepID=UPI003F8B3A3F